MKKLILIKKLIRIITFYTLMTGLLLSFNAVVSFSQKAAPGGKSQKKQIIPVKPKTNLLDEKLIAAVKSEQLEEVKKLLKQGANPNAIDRSDGFRVPVLNVILAHTIDKDTGRAISIALINAGADVNGHGNTFCTPLMLADDPEITKLLLKGGADVNFASSLSSLETPLHWAIWKPQIVPLLINAGANLNAKNSDGNTPLMDAVQRIGHDTDENGQVEPDSEAEQDLKACLESISLLLKAGADTKIKNNEGQTALTLVRESKYLRLIEILEKSGAK